MLLPAVLVVACVAAVPAGADTLTTVTNSCVTQGCTDTITVTFSDTASRTSPEDGIGSISGLNATLGSFNPISGISACSVDYNTVGNQLYTCTDATGTDSFSISGVIGATASSVIGSIYYNNLVSSSYSIVSSVTTTTTTTSTTTTTTTSTTTTSTTTTTLECDSSTCASVASGEADPVIALGAIAWGTGFVIFTAIALIRQSIGKQ